MTSASPPVFDPFDADFRQNPYSTYARLRAESPIGRSTIGPRVVSRYDDVSKLLRSADVSRNIDESAKDFTDAERELRELRGANAGAQSMLNLDPPDHSRLRGLVSRAFTPTAIERLRPRIQELVDAAIAPARDVGRIELNEELAFPLPFQVIAELLDIPTERVTEMRHWSGLLTLALEPTANSNDIETASTAAESMVGFLIEVIENRRRQLGDDLLSTLLVIEERGERLSLPELISTVVLLFVAGHETTVNLIGNAALALAQHPGQRELWRDAGEALDANAVDELLRFDGPVQNTVRVPLVDIELGAGGVLRAGHRVITLLGSANHDPDVFEAPHELRLDRPGASRHLSFAAGVHYCLGASLARLEAQIAIGTLVRTFPTWNMVNPPRWRDRVTIRGVDRLQLELR
jgi:cytochrome P450